jgi:hypothetical protein
MFTNAGLSNALYAVIETIPSLAQAHCAVSAGS